MSKNLSQYQLGSTVVAFIGMLELEPFFAKIVFHSV